MPRKKQSISPEKPHAFKAAALTYKGTPLKAGIFGPTFDTTPPCVHCGGSEFSRIHGWGNAA